MDYETSFPVDFPAALKDFAAAINDGRTYGARPKAASELRVPESTLKGWMDGRPCEREATIRRLMTMLAHHHVTTS